jgi:general secretion pathway protein E
MLKQPNGIVLVTGPTGSGKTTTLYAALQALNTADKKILTVEDPIEYQLFGVNQIQVKPQIGLDFASVLRSFLRQDPDIIMIGEIRDLETAQIAVQASLTGHLVLSTLHTNSAAATITRLIDMGVDDYLLTSTLSGVVAQRLVRTLCPHCREPYAVLPEIAQQLRLNRLTDEPDITLYRPKGCQKCGGSGYYGRISIAEVLPVENSIRSLIMRHAESRPIHEQAVKNRMRTIYEDGLRKALNGQTTVEEVMRATREV